MAGTKEDPVAEKTDEGGKEDKKGTEKKKAGRSNVGASGSVSVSISLSRSTFAELNETWTRVKSLGHWKNKQEFRSELIASGIASLNSKIDTF